MNVRLDWPYNAALEVTRSVFEFSNIVIAAFGFRLLPKKLAISYMVYMIVCGPTLCAISPSIEVILKMQEHA